MVTVFLNPWMRRLCTLLGIFFHCFRSICWASSGFTFGPSTTSSISPDISRAFIWISILKSLYRQIFSRLMLIILRTSRSWCTVMYNVHNSYRPSLTSLEKIRSDFYFSHNCLCKCIRSIICQCHSCKSETCGGINPEQENIILYREIDLFK